MNEQKPRDAHHQQSKQNSDGEYAKTVIQFEMVMPVQLYYPRRHYFTMTRLV